MTIEVKASPRERLLEATVSLTCRDGTRIGVEVLCRAAGVSKRSLCKLFDSKDELLAASLERSSFAHVAALLPAVDDERSPRGRIRHVLEQVELQAGAPEFQGCPYLGVQIELKDQSHPASRVAHRVKEDLTGFFRAEAAKGGVGDPDLLARQLSLVFDGASAHAGIRADDLAGLGEERPCGCGAVVLGQPARDDAGAVGEAVVFHGLLVAAAPVGRARCPAPVDVDDVAVAQCQDLAGEREHARSALPGTRSLIAMLFRMNRDNCRSPARSVANQEFHQTDEQASRAARSVTRALQDAGYRALNPSVGFPQEMDRFPHERIWTVAHKTVAVAAGLGVMGLHRNVIHPNRQLRPARDRPGGRGGERVGAAPPKATGVHPHGSARSSLRPAPSLRPEPPGNRSVFFFSASS